MSAKPVAEHALGPVCAGAHRARVTRVPCKVSAATALHLSRFSSLRAFGHRNFVYVWSGALVSNIGTWMETLALGVFVTTVTGRAEATGAIAAITYLPALLLSPVAGALADRFDRRAYVAVGTIVHALLAGILTVLAFTGHLTVPAVAVISFLNGCTSTLTNPGLLRPRLPSLSPPRTCTAPSASTRPSSTSAASWAPRWPPIVLSTHGIAWALLVNTVSFIAVLVALSRVRTSGKATALSREQLWPGIVRGARVARRGSRHPARPGGHPGGVPPSWPPSSAWCPSTPSASSTRAPPPPPCSSPPRASARCSPPSCSGPSSPGSAASASSRLCLLLIGPVAALYWMAPTLHLAALAMVGLGWFYMATLTASTPRASCAFPRACRPASTASTA